MHLRASPLLVNSLPLIEFSLLFILLSALYPFHCYPPLHPPFLSPSPPFSLLLPPPTLFFFFWWGGISESKHFLHIKMWNSFWHWAGNRVEPAICPYLFLSLFSLPLLLSLALSLSLFPASYYVFSPSIHGPTLPPHCLLSPRDYPAR